MSGEDGLDAERALQFAAGITYTPSKSITLSADLYQISIDNVVTLGDAVDIAGLDATLTGALGITEGEAQFLYNAADTRTRGLDLNATYVTNLFELVSRRPDAFGCYAEKYDDDKNRG